MIRKIAKLNKTIFRQKSLMVRFGSFASVKDERSLSAEELENKYVVKTYNTNGVRTKPGMLLTHGSGQYLYSDKGKKYLDFCAGIAVSSLGHADPEWAAAIADQAKTLCHVSNLFHSSPYLALAKLLVDNSCFDRAFFCNSGTEANEAAFKFARLYGKKVQSAGTKTKVIAFKNGFHGRSMGALSLTYKPVIREPFFPLIPGISFANFNALEEAESLMDDDVCAVIVEPVQGEGGITAATPEFMKGLRKLCDDHDALLICDEVQCGLGRTGQLWAHEVYGIEPDIMTLAKPLAAGLPIGAVLVQEKVADAVSTGSHGTTFGGNPLVCRAGEVVINRMLAPGFLETVRSRGRYLASRLQKLEQKYPEKIKEIRMPIGNEGLFAGVELIGPVSELISDAADEGVLFISAGANVIRLCPPLIVTNEDIDHAINVLDKLIGKRSFSPVN